MGHTVFGCAVNVVWLHKIAVDDYMTQVWPWVFQGSLLNAINERADRPIPDSMNMDLPPSFVAVFNHLYEFVIFRLLSFSGDHQSTDMFPGGTT